MGRKTVIISLVGKQGAGKSTIGEKLARYLDTTHIEVSKVVRELHKDIEERSALSDTGKKTRTEPDWLGSAVYNRLFPTLRKNTPVAVITGVREIEVHKYLKKMKLSVIGVEIKADPDLRYKRLLELKKIQSPSDFLDMEVKERNLGVNEVIDSCKYEIATSDETKPDQVVRALVSKLVKEGSNLR